jgi:UDP-2-acetamido-2-deoxy-ribo-hexuluronate aminotransferase
VIAVSIPFVDLAAQYSRLRPLIEANIQKVLDHGQYIMGPEVAELEARLAEVVGARHVVAMSSGTDALLACLMAHGVGRGHAVFVPSFTFPATAEVPTLLGATPVFVDVGVGHFNIDADSLRRELRRVKREGRLEVRAVIAVDLFGLPANHPVLEEIAQQEGLLVVDDAAQAVGGAIDGRPIGTLAPLTTTSFYPAKPFGGYGDGGAVFTDDDEAARGLRSIRQHGQGNDRYEIVRLGLNGRLDSLQAAVLLAKLTIFAEEIEKREALARYYDGRLSQIVETPVRPEGYISAWAQYTIQVNNRDRVREVLSGEGIPTAVHYPRPMHLQPAYARYGRGEGSLPVSERLSRRVLSLPMHPYLKEQDAERICDAIHRAIRST